MARTLRTAQLGTTGLQTTRVGFGAWAIGGGGWEARRDDTIPGAVTIAWTLRNPVVDAAIVGFRRPDQVDPLLAAADLDLTAEDLAEIEGGAE